MGYEVIASEAITEKETKVLMGYGNSHEGYYRKREKRRLRAVSNSSETITEIRSGNNRG